MRHHLKGFGTVLLGCAAVIAVGGCFDTSTGTAGPDPGVKPPDTGGGTTNQAPSISGTPPPSVLVGNNYSFTPSASDPDSGDTLTFSIQNMPPWANFDPSSGTLSGVAGLGTEGIYDSIQITVSDGSLSDSTATFSLEVIQVALGSAVLSWTPPTENTDGSPLMDLSGYKIYYGNQQGSYPNQILVNNPGLTTYVVEDLVPNTYYFVSTSVNSTGIESEFSNVAVKTIN